LVRLSRNCVRQLRTGAVKGPDLVQLFEGRGKNRERKNIMGPF